jgi:hypothetical protein
MIGARDSMDGPPLPTTLMLAPGRIEEGYKITTEKRRRDVCQGDDAPAPFARRRRRRPRPDVALNRDASIAARTLLQLHRHRSRSVLWLPYLTRPFNGFQADHTGVPVPEQHCATRIEQRDDD